MSNVLITGGAGFVGSNLTDRLVAQGDKVTIVDDLSMGLVENITHEYSHPFTLILTFKKFFPKTFLLCTNFLNA